jgi:hypothetical protein
MLAVVIMTPVFDEILQLFRLFACLFVKPNRKHVPDEVAREKVAYGFRSVKKQHVMAMERSGAGGGGGTSDNDGDLIASSWSLTNDDDVDMIDAHTGKRLRLV